MKNSIYKKWLTATFCFICITTQTAKADGLVIFGDSLSDMGNLASIQGNFPAPFYEGTRISNGPVTVEVLASLLEEDISASLHLIGTPSGNNYAVAGARAATNTAIDLETQIGAYLQANSGVADPTAIHIVFIGGNDIRDARDADSGGGTIINTAVDNIINQLQLLITAGAQSIMVVGAPDIGVIPESALLAQDSSSKRPINRATRYTNRFNQKLRKEVRSIENANNLDFVYFSLDRVLNNVFRDAQARQFDNTQNACFNSSTFQFHADCDFETFTFFDQIHPTARTHQIAGRIMSGYIPVPEIE